MGKTEIDKTKLMFQKQFFLLLKIRWSINTCQWTGSMEINQNNNSNDDNDDKNNNNNNNAIKTNRPQQ